jgi:hypothetical protein
LRDAYERCKNFISDAASATVNPENGIFCSEPGDCGAASLRFGKNGINFVAALGGRTVFYMRKRRKGHVAGKQKHAVRMYWPFDPFYYLARVSKKQTM